MFVLDGLRPDAINPGDTPTLFRLRQEGVYYLNSHAVFPTVTRVNAAAIGTGAYPGTNGIVSNVMYVPEVNQGRPFSLGEFQHLVSLEAVSGGQLILVKTLESNCRRMHCNLPWSVQARLGPPCCSIPMPSMASAPW